MSSDRYPCPCCHGLAPFQIRSVLFVTGRLCQRLAQGDFVRPGFEELSNGQEAAAFIAGMSGRFTVCCLCEAILRLDEGGRPHVVGAVLASEDRLLLFEMSSAVAEFKKWLREQAEQRPS